MWSNSVSQRLAVSSERHERSIGQSTHVGRVFGSKAHIGHAIATRCLVAPCSVSLLSLPRRCPPRTSSRNAALGGVQGPRSSCYGLDAASSTAHSLASPRLLTFIGLPIRLAIACEPLTGPVAAETSQAHQSPYLCVHVPVRLPPTRLTVSTVIHRTSTFHLAIATKLFRESSLRPSLHLDPRAQLRFFRKLYSTRPLNTAAFALYRNHGRPALRFPHQAVTYRRFRCARPSRSTKRVFLLKLRPL